MKPMPIVLSVISTFLISSSSFAANVQLDYTEVGNFYDSNYSTKNSGDLSTIKKLLASSPCLLQLFKELKTAPIPFKNRSRCSNDSRYFRLKVKEAKDSGLAGVYFYYDVVASVRCSDGQLGEASYTQEFSEGLFKDPGAVQIDVCTANYYLKSMKESFEQKQENQRKAKEASDAVDAQFNK